MKLPLSAVRSGQLRHMIGLYFNYADHLAMDKLSLLGYSDRFVLSFFKDRFGKCLNSGICLRAGSAE